jgi:hypothetical protein
MAPPFLALTLVGGEFFSVMSIYHPFSLGNARPNSDAVVSALDIFPKERLYTFNFPSLRATYSADTLDPCYL